MVTVQGKSYRLRQQLIQNCLRFWRNKKFMDIERNPSQTGTHMSFQKFINTLWEEHRNNTSTSAKTSIEEAVKHEWLHSSRCIRRQYQMKHPWCIWSKSTKTMLIMDSDNKYVAPVSYKYHAKKIQVHVLWLACFLKSDLLLNTNSRWTLQALLEICASFR